VRLSHANPAPDQLEVSWRTPALIRRSRAASKRHRNGCCPRRIGRQTPGHQTKSTGASSGCKMRTDPSRTSSSLPRPRCHLSGKEVCLELDRTILSQFLQCTRGSVEHPDQSQGQQRTFGVSDRSGLSSLLRGALLSRYVGVRASLFPLDRPAEGELAHSGWTGRLVLQRHSESTPHSPGNRFRRPSKTAPSLSDLACCLATDIWAQGVPSSEHPTDCRSKHTAAVSSS